MHIRLFNSGYTLRFVGSLRLYRVIVMLLMHSFAKCIGSGNDTMAEWDTSAQPITYPNRSESVFWTSARVCLDLLQYGTQVTKWVSRNSFGF